MISLRHVEADVHLRPLHTSILDKLKMVWAIIMLSQGHIGASLYLYTRQVGPSIGNSGLVVEWKRCHNVIFEAYIHLRLLHTSTLDICTVFEPLVCCLNGTWLHPYTFTPAKLVPDLGIQVHLMSKNDVIPGCLKLISTSDHVIHPY